MKSKKENVCISIDTKIVEDVDSKFRKYNCKSRSEYIENAVKFYNSYLDSEGAEEFLARSLTPLLKSIDSDLNALRKMLYNMILEMNISNFLQSLQEGLALSNDDYSKLRGMAVKEIKETSKLLNMKHASDKMCEYMTDETNGYYRG